MTTNEDSEAYNDDRGREFGRWKSRLIEAIGLDIRLTSTQRLVAQHMLSFANRNTRRIFPSQDSLALRVGTSSRTIKAAVSALRKFGWLQVDRPDKRKSNNYRFLDDQVEAMLARRFPKNTTNNAEGQHSAHRTGSFSPHDDSYARTTFYPSDGPVTSRQRGSELPGNNEELTVDMNHGRSAGERGRRSMPYVHPNESLDRLEEEQNFNRWRDS